ncbi:FtsQ-type POTRA domain-containing protein [Desulfogranum marinum]|jgi:cell division septal protein FtsQ|uniref:cell division protein FtsQ/DivIB n=1 Tax=Desulfogranum marinum TaxID=453220 RepID=UPI0029C6141C|nr:FtsQ-type POTRA domain-containing protein [Desulfogranum marinum]
MVAYTPGGFSPRPPKKKKGVLVRILDRLKRKITRKKHNPSPPGMQHSIVGAQRQAQIKWYSRGVATLVFLCVIAGFFSWGAYALLMRSDVFRLTDIQVKGQRVSALPQILKKGNIEQGQSLFAVNTKAAERAISSLPWVERVTLTKRWPSAIEIKVREHRPLALVNIENASGSKLFYLNNKGALFAPLLLGQDFDYPVITGIKWGTVKSANQLPQGTLAESALVLLKLAAKGNAILPIQSISEVHVDNRQGLIVYLVDQPFPIYFGTEKIYTRYYRLVKILERLYRKKKIEGIASIRMDYMENKVLVARAELDR